MFTSLPELMSRPTPVRAPLALNPLMARMAEKAGFEAVYLGGGGLGYAKVHLEANLNSTEMAHAGMDIATVTSLPVILDGAAGWGDAMHQHRTIRMAEAAGFAAIEIEDGVFPKRAGHHADPTEDHLVPVELMCAKIRAAVEARRNPDFLIIARASTADPEDALRRSEAYLSAGADVLQPILTIVDADTIARVSRELDAPLMFLAPPGGLDGVGMTQSELYDLGYRILGDAMTLHLMAFEILSAGYSELAGADFAVRGRSSKEWWGLVSELNEAIDLDVLLEIEARGTDAG